MEKKTKWMGLVALPVLAVAAGAAVLVQNQRDSAVTPAAVSQQVASAPQTTTDGASVQPVAATDDEPRQLDVPYVPTPESVVAKMLELAKPTKTDIVYDLGCGDGRIVITAAKKYGVRGVGVDLDPQRIRESKENAQKAGVADRVQFMQQDLFKTDFSKATVLTLYLLPEVNRRLRAKIYSDLKPGTRIVSHAFDMGDWKPDQTVEVRNDENDYARTVYYWVLPAHVAGTWQWTVTGAPAGQNNTLELAQKYQEVSGTLNSGGGAKAITDVKIVGDQLTFSVEQGTFTGRVNGNILQGTWKDAAGVRNVKATRKAGDLPSIISTEPEGV